jgi:hypothetical protein
VAALNGATLYLRALERGYAALTRNIRGFDLMNHILLAGRVLFYRTAYRLWLRHSSISRRSKAP